MQLSPNVMTYTLLRDKHSHLCGEKKTSAIILRNALEPFTIPYLEGHCHNIYSCHSLIYC